MADKETTFRVNMTGWERVKKGVDDLGKSFDATTKKAQQAAKAVGSGAVFDAWKKHQDAGAWMKRDETQQQREIDRKRWRKYDNPNFIPTIRDLERDKPPGWQAAVAELRAEEHASRTAISGGTHRPSNQGYSNATWARNRFRSFYRGIPLAIGAAAGAGALFGFGELLSEAKNSEMLRKQLAIQLGQGPDAIGQMAAMGPGLGLAGTQIPQFFRSYIRTAGASATSLEEANAAGQWAIKMGLQADQGQVVGSYAQARKLGAFGPGSISATEYMNLMERAINNAGMKGRDLEFLESMNVSLEHLVDTKGSVSLEATAGIRNFLTTMNQTGIPGLQGMHGAQYLNALHGGMNAPGGGATGLYLMAKATGAQTPWELMKMQEEGPFGKNNLLESKILPYMIANYGDSFGGELASIMKIWMPGTSIEKNQAMIDAFKKGGGKFTPEDRARFAAEAQDTGMSLIQELAKTREAFVELASKLLNAVEGLTKIIGETVTAINTHIGPYIEDLSNGVKDIAEWLTGDRSIAKSANSWVEGNISDINNWASGWQTSGANAIDSAIKGGGGWLGKLKSKVGSKVSDAVSFYSGYYNVPEPLVWSVMNQESGGNAGAVSSTGAGGLMQLMPRTASGLGVANRFDPIQNVDGGTKYLSQLLKKYNGNIHLALAAYNAGPGTVDKYGGIPPYAETMDYVGRVTGYYASAGRGGTLSRSPVAGEGQLAATVNIFANGEQAEQFSQLVATGDTSTGVANFDATRSLKLGVVQ